MASKTIIRFDAPRSVEVATESVGSLSPGEVRIETVLSAVSPGTETLVYKGKAPESLSSDSSIEALSGELSFPITYGYATVGRVVDAGKEVEDPSEWIGQRVFSFQPHVSQFDAPPDELIPLPDAVSFSDGVMIPSVETAVSFAMDGRPMVGEKAVVFGQGIIGLLTTALLSHYPLDRLYTVDPIPSRRDRSKAMGADRAFPPDAVSGALASKLGCTTREAQQASGKQYEGADLVFELSGQPQVLNQAIALAGFDARILVGSWYGTKTASQDLGGRFHRSRIDISSSQVSSIAPQYRGRWTKGRRMETVLDLLDTIAPHTLVSHKVSPDDAPSLYRRLDEGDGEDLLQPVFQYE